MADRDAKTKAPANGARVALVASILVGAAMIAAVGALIPRLLELTGSEATWIPFVFYAIAAIDVLIALWLRARLKKARQSSDRGGGTVQRQ